VSALGATSGASTKGASEGGRGKRSAAGIANPAMFERKFYAPSCLIHEITESLADL